ncbi:hypothetical protein K488DRAFT_45386 [Vararia minispora EC-137]|uniref:Uncharacterized protein n=1 Tax=Vararia minispora EC-137 TaxID=1314806 RepID=A0ACB8QS85_9AGAM|nr:hypothetical protein K488DRAFT_45386 [Vararia minispora EC-137]
MDSHPLPAQGPVLQPQPISRSLPLPSSSIQQHLPNQPVKIYNAVYSSVQVYECMVRGIAVMRRRSDSYVNATQILKVAGVDKGRRTKILEKEILPGKHEIVQGGYGKYQGTWIPLERGRDIATQYNVSDLLSPLFDFVPNSAASSMGSLPPIDIASYPSALPSAPITPGSALRLLNQGRAQGLFTPSSSLNQTVFGTSQFPTSSANVTPGVSPTPPPIVPPLKRTRSDTDAAHNQNYEALQAILHAQMNGISSPPDVAMDDHARPASAAPLVPVHVEDIGSPSKRARTEPPLPPQIPTLVPTSASLALNPVPAPSAPNDPSPSSTTSQPTNGVVHASSSQSHSASGTMPNGTSLPETNKTRFATKPIMPKGGDRTAPLKDHRRAPVVSAIIQRDDPDTIMDLLREIPSDDPLRPISVDVVLDELGHTALHIAASMGRLKIVNALLAAGADVLRGNYNGETALIRAALMTNNFDAQSFGMVVGALHVSVRTIDTARKSVLHHIVALAGIRNRAIVAGYYLEQIFMWIAEHEGGDFKSLVDLQDEHGDTALNIAARVGNRSLVRSLVDVGANRVLPNKLGLRPGDFGVEVEELGGGPRVEDIIASLRTGPSIPVQKSQDVIADMTTMIQSLSAEFTAELKAKQDALDVTQAHLRAATRELSEQRKQIQTWQTRCADLDRVHQRMRNVDRASKEEDTFDWTGRTENGEAGPAFVRRVPPISNFSGHVGQPLVPLADNLPSLIRLRRLKMWQTRAEQLLEQRLKNLRGASAEKEFQCKKIIALCSGVPPDKVESILDDLVIAIESETAALDVGRLSGFMQKVPTRRISSRAHCLPCSRFGMA